MVLPYDKKPIMKPLSFAPVVLEPRRRRNLIWMYFLRVTTIPTELHRLPKISMLLENVDAAELEPLERQ